MINTPLRAASFRTFAGVRAGVFELVKPSQPARLCRSLAEEVFRAKGWRVSASHFEHALTARGDLKLIEAVDIAESVGR
jgi:hypothetical protein